MDITFQPQTGESFTIEVGYFDTVLEIKEKVQKYQGIPVSQQTLIFNGQVLQDDRDIEYCELLHRSVVLLFISPSSDSDKPQLKIDESLSTKKIHLKINIPSSKIHHLPLAVDANDTILHVKEKFHENIESVPINNIVIQSNNVELQDHRSLHDYELIDSSEIDVIIKSSPTADFETGSRENIMESNDEKLNLWVVGTSWSKRIPVEVYSSDNVVELKEELQKLNQSYNLFLPKDGYFLLYKQNVMDDSRSLHWHRVHPGDIIEISEGSVTGG